MTGKKYLDNRGSKSVLPGFHDFKYILSKNYWVFFITIAFFVIVIPFSTAGLPGDSIFNVEVTHDQLKFRLIHERALLATLVGCVVSGLISGIVSFRFMLDKKETTIFFSLGLTRLQLFRNRCIAGLLMLFAGIAIPLFISMGLNIKVLGVYNGLVRNTFYILAGLTITAFISYFVAAIVSALAGTLAETIIYWCGIMAAPYAICYALNTLMKTLFWGNPWGVMTYSETGMVMPDLTTRFAWMDPFTFFYEQLQMHAQFFRPLESAVPPAIEPGVLVGWSIVSVILLLLGILFVKRRKAEVAGIAGTNRCLSEWLIAVTSFLVFALIFTFLYQFSPKLAVILSIAGFAVMHLFWRKSLFSYEMTGRKNVCSLAVGVAVSLFICVCFFTGGFQSIQKYLDQGEPVLAKISYVGAPSYLYETADGSSTGRGYYLTSQITFENRDEIDRIKDIQKSFIADGRQAMASNEDDFGKTVVPYDVIFEYVDADGKNHIWYYDRASLEQLERILALEDTSTVISGQEHLFTGNLESEQTVWAREAYQQGTVYLTDMFCSQTYELELTAQQRQELLEAVGKDKMKESYTDKYFPAETAKAVLMFSRNGEYDCEYFSYNLDNAFLYLTDQDQNTLDWLERNQLLGLLSDNVQIESITLQKFDPYIGINDMKYPFGMYFMSYRAETLDEFLIQKDFGTKYTITDEDKLAQLLPGLRNGYFMSEGGYLAAVKTVGMDGYIYLFLPAEDIPDFVKG